MISEHNGVFKLDTKETSYIFRISQFGHVLGEYYGNKIIDKDDYSFSKEKWSFMMGTSTAYDDKINSNYSLDSLSLEVSTVGKGDYKEPSIMINTSKGFVLDLKYVSFEIKSQFIPLKDLPSFYGNAEELIIKLYDEVQQIEVELHYVVFFETNVIGRYTKITNKGKETISLNKAMSMQLEMPNKKFSLLNLYGCRGSEGNKSLTKLDHLTYICDSKTGNSSNRHNPFFMLISEDASFNQGEVYGFNLIYSGNHIEMVEHSTFDKVRVQTGINPYCFQWNLTSEESFETPYAILTYSNKGINKASQNFHDFINDNVISGIYKHKERPVVINNWEVTGMKFKQSDISTISKEAKKFGIDLCVLDDGWFGRRNDDTKGLGDFDENKKKLPSGLKGLAKKINSIGLKFGLWFEPEMISENSKLFEEHPDWAISTKERKSSQGRHQLVLDYTRKEVRDYIVDSINKVLESANIEYVKWDMNRNISDFSSEIFSNGELFHRYMIGLYDVISRITKNNPKVLFEGCASGGNRFDLGILCYMSQIWTSDDTDAYERISIQSGMALGYPLSTLSNHVSASPSHQVLRFTPLDTRFNVASFGILGFEMDLSHLNKVERKAIISAMSFYKKHKALFQYGDFYQMSDIKKDNHAIWVIESKDKNEALVGYFNGLQRVNESIDILRTNSLEENAMYKIEVRHQDLNIKMFGSLINMLLPIRLNENGLIINTVAKHKTISGENESYILSGGALNSGALKLQQQWMGTGIDNTVRCLGDFGSRVYYIKKIS